MKVRKERQQSIIDRRQAPQMRSAQGVLYVYCLKVQKYIISQYKKMVDKALQMQKYVSFHRTKRCTKTQYFIAQKAGRQALQMRTAHKGYSAAKTKRCHEYVTDINSSQSVKRLKWQPENAEKPYMNPYMKQNQARNLLKTK